MGHLFKSLRGQALRTRLIGYGGLLIWTLLALFGPQMGEQALRILGCPGGHGHAGAACGGPLQGLTAAVAAWVSTAPPIDTVFLLVHQLWPLLLLWAAAVLVSARAEPAGHQDRVRGPVAGAEQRTAPPVAQKLAPQEAQAQWIEARQREQAGEVQAEQRSLSEQLFAEARFLGYLAVACWTLIFGLLAFCLAFGLPLLGGINAEHTLNAFGCQSVASAPVDALMSACGALEERFEPYLRPFYGALFSPLWLFTQFGDLLLLWLATILLLVLLPALRLGARRLIRAYPATALALLVATMLAAMGFIVASTIGPDALIAGSSRPSDPVPALAALEVIITIAAMGTVILLLALCSLLTVFLLTRRSRRQRNA